MREVDLGRSEIPTSNIDVDGEASVQRTPRLIAILGSVIATTLLVTASGVSASSGSSTRLAAPTDVRLAVQLDCVDGPCLAADGTYGVIAVFRDNATGEDAFEYEIQSEVAGALTVPGLPARGSGGIVASVPYPATPGDRFCLRIRAVSGDARGKPSPPACARLRRNGVLLPT